MKITDTLMELLLEDFDAMGSDERTAWSMADAEAWVHDQRLKERQDGLPVLECDAETVHAIMCDFIEAYGIDNE